MKNNKGKEKKKKNRTIKKTDSDGYLHTLLKISFGRKWFFLKKSFF